MFFYISKGVPNVFNATNPSSSNFVDAINIVFVLVALLGDLRLEKVRLLIEFQSASLQLIDQVVGQG